MSDISILIVEDEAIVAADLACKVRQLGYDVAGTTTTGEEAVELARRLRPSLVLMDIRLAGAMDGIAAAREIHRGNNLPVLFLTAHSDTGTVERAQQADAIGYILKPFDDRDLRIQIEMALYKHATERRLRESEAQLRKATAELLVANTKLLDSRRATINMMQDAVNARRQAEETSIRMQQAKKDWEHTFDSVPDLIAIIDNQHRIRRVNQAMARFIGADPDQCIGQSCFFSFHGSDHPLELFPHTLTMTDAQMHESEIHDERLGADFMVTTTPLFNDSGQINGTVHVARDITQSKQIEDTLRFLGMSGTGGSGEGFFQEMARFLARILRMDFVCIDLLEEDRLSARTLAVFHDGRFEDNVSYTLKDTPCGDVVGRNICCFPENVCKLFPRDEVLQDLQAESYLGTTLWSTVGKPIGLIAVIGRQALADTRQAEAILQLVSVRAAGELESMLAGENLRKSEIRFRDIASASADWIWEIDSNCRYIFASGNVKKLLGYEPDEILGRTPYDLMPADEAVRLRQEFQSITSRCEPFKDLENDNLHKNGEIRHILTSGVPVFDEHGVLRGYRGVDKDITERKMSETALIESEARYRSLFEGSLDGIFALDGAGRLLTANPASARISGYTVEELTSKNFAELCAPDQLTATTTAFLEALNGTSRAIETAMIHKDGRRVELVVSSAPMIVSGSIQGLFCVASDITERKRAEDALRDSEERLRFHMDNSPMAVIEWDKDFIVTRWTGAAKQVFGWSAEETVGKPIIALKMVFEDDLPIVERTMAQLSEGNPKHVVSTNRNYTSSGEIRYCTWYNSVLMDKQGRMRSVLSKVIDITGLKLAEEELKKSEERYRGLVEQTVDGIFVADARGNYLDVNTAGKEMLGYTYEEILRLNISDVIIPEEVPRIGLEVAKFADGKVVNSEWIFRRKDGSTFIGEIVGRQFPDGRLQAILRDITERKQIEIELQQAHDVLELRVEERTTELADMVNTLLVEIDEREKAEEALEKTANELEDLYNLAPCGYHSLDKDGMFIRINDTELKWLGYDRDEVVGKLKASDIMTPESLAVFSKNYPRFKAGKDISELRLSFIRKDGSILPALLNASPILNDKGDFLMSRSTIYDITELVKAEESLRRLNLLYLTLSETGKAIARINDRNELFQEICRISVVHGGFRMAWIGLVDGESDLVQPVAAFGSGTDYLDNIRISTRLEPQGMGPTGSAIRDGRYYICNNFMADSRTTPWRNEAEDRGFRASAALAIFLNGTAIGALTIYAAEQDFFDPQITELLIQMQTDISFALDNLDREARRRESERALQTEISERLRAMEALREKEQMLIQQNRHAVMGEMIGNIAHQWRQPLNTLGLFTQRLGFFYGSPSFNKEFLDTSVAKSMEIIQYMSRTIDDFRSFFSIDREKSVFRADEVVNKALSLVDASFRDRRIIIEREERVDVIIHGFPNEYAQVLLNIFLNAKDALNERNVEFPWLKITIDTENGASLVTIADNAGGIPEDIIDKIFDPYFTTKGPQQGTGVGLFMSKSIIELNMGGRLSVRNTDVGAEFRIEV